MTLTTILVVLMLCCFLALLYLITVAGRIARAIESVAWAVDGPRRELAELEHEREQLRDIVFDDGANEEDFKRMDEVEAKIARRTRRQRSQQEQQQE